MTVEHQPFFQERIERLQEEGVEVIVEGDPSLIDRKEPFWMLISELLNNCEDNGAGLISIKIEEGRLTVGDDVIHNNPDEILTNLNSPNPKSTKGGSHGRVSILLVRKKLAKIGGELRYYAQEGRIMAVATWKT